MPPAIIPVVFAPRVVISVKLPLRWSHERCGITIRKRSVPTAVFMFHPDCASQKAMVRWRYWLRDRRHSTASAMTTRWSLIAMKVFRLSPNVAEHVVGGLACYTDGLANPMLTSKAYAATAIREGVKILSGTRVIEAKTTSRGFAVRTGGGKAYEGELLVNATGAWAGRFSAMLGDPLPVVATAPTMMVTDRLPGMMNGTSLGLTGRLLGLMAAENGSIIVGGGYRSPLDLETEKIWVEPMEMAKAAKIMIEIMPRLRDAQMIRCWTAFEGSIKDKVPIAGASTKVPGLFHVCGFSAHGFQLAPIMGRVMSQIVLGKEPQLSLDDFRPDRFE